MINFKNTQFCFVLLLVIFLLPLSKVEALTLGDTGYGWVSSVSEVVGDDLSCSSPSKIRQELYLRDRYTNAPISVNSAVFAVYNKTTGAFIESTSGTGPNVGTVCWNPDTDFINIRVLNSTNPSWHDFQAAIKTNNPSEFPRGKHMRTTAYLVDNTVVPYEYMHSEPATAINASDPVYKIEMPSFPNTYGATGGGEVTLFVRDYNPTTDTLGVYRTNGTVYPVSGVGEFTLPAQGLSDGWYSWAFYLKLNGGHDAGGGFIQNNELMSGHSDYSAPFMVDRTSPVHWTTAPNTPSPTTKIAGVRVTVGGSIVDELSGVREFKIYMDGVRIDTCPIYANIRQAYCNATSAPLAAGAHYYRFEGVDAAGNVYIGSDRLITVLPSIVPTISDSRVSNIQNTLAALHAYINPNNSTTTAYFKYGTASSSLCSTLVGTVINIGAVGNGSGAVYRDYPLTGLTPLTQYYYCAYATNAFGTGYGEVIPFFTQSLPDLKREVSFSPLNSNIASTTNFNVSFSNDGYVGSTPTNVYYWLVQGVTKTLLGSVPLPAIPARTYNIPVIIPINVATSGNYVLEYCADSSFAGDTGIVIENDETNNCHSNGFSRTNSNIAPVLVTSSATNIGSDAARINGYLSNAGGTTTKLYLRYSTTTAPDCDSLPNATTVRATYPFGGSMTLYGYYYRNLINLTPATDYYYCALGSNYVGTTTGAVRTFSTLEFEDIVVIDPYATGTIPVPTGLSATLGTCGTGQIDLDWDNQLNITHFDLEIDGGTPIVVAESIVSGSPYKPYTFISGIPGNPHTFRVRAIFGANASFWTAPMVVTSPSSCTSGYIVANSCTITVGSSTCQTTVVWDSTDFSGTPEIAQGATVFSNSPSNLGGTVRDVSPSDNTFTLTDLGGGLVDTAVATILCDTGSVLVNAGGSWQCVPLPVVTVNTSPNVIRSGKSATIEAEVDSAFTLECTISDGGSPRTFDHTGTPSSQTSSTTTRPLTAAQMVNVECGSLLYPALRSSNEVRVRVVPTYQEI